VLNRIWRGWRAMTRRPGRPAVRHAGRASALLVVALLALYPAGLAQATTGGPAAAPPERAGRLAGSRATTPPASVQDAPARQIDPNVVVQITSPTPGQHLSGPVDITGYAADTRSQDGSGMNERDIQLYLNDSSDPWNIFDYAVGGRDSPDAAAALGPQFSQAGFWDAWETCTFPEGPYKLIVWVSSRATEGARNFASVDVYIDACPQGTMIGQANFDSEPGGVYTIRLNGPETRQHSLDPIFADFAAGIDARCPDATVNCTYGLQFRELPGPQGTNTDSFYRFTVDPTDGTFTLGYSPPGDAPIVALVPWTPSPTIAQGSATNRLAVIVQGNWLRLFINGQQVGDTRDDRRPWGQIGWVAETTASRTVEAQFDNFSVSTPGPAEQLAPLFPGAGVGPAPAAGRVLLHDDFSDPSSGWPRQSSDPSARRVGYDHGEYDIARMPGDVGAPYVTRSDRFGDFQVEIDARLVPPTENSYLYLDFRRQDDGSHYSFMVDPNDSTFMLRRNGPNSGVNLIPWTSAPAIQGGSARNRLGVRAQGPDITLLVNGQEVGHVQDGTFSEGTLAFGVDSFNDGPAEGRFGNLLVTAVD